MTVSPASRFIARTPEDMLAIVPAVLGFHPEESLVMLTFGGRRAFHARVDLPDARGEPSQLDQLAEVLLAPALRQRPEKVLVIAYSADAALAAQAALHISDVFAARGFVVLRPLRSDGRSWAAVRPDEDPACAELHPYDLASHPLTARGVLAGRVTLSSRAELAATLAPDVEAVARVAVLVRSARPLTSAELSELVACHAARGSEPGEEAVARLVLSCRDVDVRDAAFDDLTNADAEGHVEVWRSVVRRTPEEDVAAPASVLAFCAWLAGHGALAWCAVDRARAADPAYGLAGCVADLLQAAVPPQSWSAIGRPRVAPEP